MSAKNITYTAVISYVQRLGTSVNGNPRFRVHFVQDTGAPEFSAITQSDAALSYGIERFVGQLVTVSATPANRIYGLERVESE